MSKSAVRTIGRWAGISISAALAGVGVIALHHALETPQPLKSVLPGEAHLYLWRRRSIFYKVLGPTDAPPLVLLHRPDIGASGHEMLHIMSPLAQIYRVYALDLLGFGLSDRPGMEYSAELYNALCQDFLREVVQEPATLVASGLSCNYAISVGASAPDLCASLVLISPLTLQGHQQSSSLQQLAEKPLVKALLYPLLSTRLAFLLTRRVRREDGEDFAQFYANTHQLGAEHAAMARLAGKLAEDMEQEFATLQQPILMIWGTHALDSQHTVARLHKTAMLANSARQSRKVELIQGAALAVHKEQPEGVIAAIKHWQEETHRGMLPALEKTPTFRRSTTDGQSARASALLAPLEQTEAPLPVQVRISSKPAEFSAPTGAKAGEFEEAVESVTPMPTQANKVEETVETVALPSADLAREASTLNAAEDAASARGESEEPQIIAYCVKCKQKRKMLQAREIVMKNGRPAMRGVCSFCGTRINRIGGIS